MKILFIENAGTLSAGAFHSLVALIENLQKYNIESYVALPDRANGVKLLEEKKIPYIQMRTLAYSRMISLNASKKEYMKMPIKRLFVKLAAKKLAKYARENQIDIVHQNTSACYMGMYVAKLTGAKHVWHIREFMEEDFGAMLWPKKNAIKDFNKADAVIAISKAIYDKYVTFIEDKKLKLVYNGLDVNKYWCSDREILETEKSKVLCVGRVCEGKGQHLLIQAAGILKEKNNIDIEVLLAGSYSKETFDKLTALAEEYNVTENIVFLGQCSNMESMYKQVDIFCMTSKCEAFGRVTVEAMLAGALVIGSESGGTKEIIEHGVSGLLYEVGKAESLADSICCVLNDKMYARKIAKQGQTVAKTKYDAARNAKEIYEIYVELLEEE